MKLDVVLPTYNRSDHLALALRSLLDAPAPVELEVTILVIDNNSVDDTRSVVERFQKNARRQIRYIPQPLQGSSQSRNAGITGGTAELLGFIDDDEQITPEWFNAIAREFADPATDYLSGPCLANAEIPMPGWIPPGYNGVLGVTPARERQLMDAAFPGILLGGNAVMRRSLFERVGMYNTSLGRSGTGLLSEEDADLYRRVQAAGLRGYYVPDMAILHHIPASRLTRRYYRRWCYWRGISQGLADRHMPEPVVYLLGIPRYRLREGLAGLLPLAGNLRENGSADAFKRELPWWTLLGFLRGRFFTRARNLYKKKS